MRTAYAERNLPDPRERGEPGVDKKKVVKFIPLLWISPRKTLRERKLKNFLSAEFTLSRKAHETKLKNFLSAEFTLSRKAHETKLKNLLSAAFTLSRTAHEIKT